VSGPKRLEPLPLDPFDRPLDRVLEGLRKACGPDPYRLIPGRGDEPDRWAARCPLHPDAGYTLLVTGLPGDEADLWCSIGCPPGVLRSVLVPDPEAEKLAAARAKVLLWAQSYGERRAA
jgi:hypothetical protein